VESHVPELAVGRARPFPVGKPAEVRSWNREAPRPARLFRRPEPVEAVMAITPDDPPSQFRWRGQVHRVRRAEGPERIGEEWWRGQIEEVRTDHVRDYYRVEDMEGGRFWLFRAGLYGDPATPPQWWLHGVFG
jgi:protein ImuB